MKFACERCGKRYATTEEPLPGRVYRIRCRACGHVIVLRGPAAVAAGGSLAAASPSPPPPPPVEAPPPAPTVEAPLAAGDGAGTGDGAWREPAEAATPGVEAGASAAAHSLPDTPAPEVPPQAEIPPPEPPVAPEPEPEAAPEPEPRPEPAPQASGADQAPAPQRPVLELGRMSEERPRSRVLLVVLGVAVLLALAAVVLLRAR